MVLAWALWLLFVPLTELNALHLSGTFKSKEFFLFLAKFGFQKVDSNNIASTSGYIYGNISSADVNSTIDWDIYLVVLDSQYFIQFYSQRDLNSPERCYAMFSKIDTIAWDKYCFSQGKEDFLRRVPCPRNQLCTEELADPSAVIPGNQFTYHIVDQNQPRFWYVSLVACHRARKKKQCHWSHNTSIDLAISYDIWFVNGDPASKHLNPFEHQFSYEMHDVLEIYLAFLILNGLLLTIQLWVFRNQKHVLLHMLTFILILEVVGIFFNLVNISVFALNGRGVPTLRILGNFADTSAQCIMMLELLYIAKGWTISCKTITQRKIPLYVIWSLYTVVYIILFAFTLLAIDPIRDRDEWQTIPGYCILVFRVVLMLYFLYELQDTFVKEGSPIKRSFYSRFGAGFLVWFIYLPIVALVSPKIAALWRYKTLLGIQSGADIAFLAILVHLFWPGGGTTYFEIPIDRNTSNNNNDSVRAALISAGEDSSEDELYERQASIRLNPIGPTYKYASTNGHKQTTIEDEL